MSNPASASVVSTSPPPQTERHGGRGSYAEHQRNISENRSRREPTWEQHARYGDKSSPRPFIQIGGLPAIVGTGIISHSYGTLLDLLYGQKTERGQLEYDMATTF